MAAILKDDNLQVITIGPAADLDLLTLTNTVVTVAGELSATTLDIGGTDITATAAELNVMDAGATVTTPTVAGGDAFVMDDLDVGMRQVDIDNVDTYLSATTKTLTNKTLTSPDINTPDIDGGTIDGVTLGGTLAGTPTYSGVGTHSALDIFDVGASVKNGSTSAGFVKFFENSGNGSNSATLIGPASTADVVVTLPAATDTLVGKATTDTLTNKTITSPTINTPTITGDTTFSDGAYNFTIASHDGSNGLVLGSTLVTKTGAQINALVSTSAANNFTEDQTLSSSDASQPVLNITNTHDGATSGELRFNKDSTGDDNDIMGMISFYGTDSSDQAHERLAYMDAIITDAAHGSEAASLRFYTAVNDATLVQGLAIEGQADAAGEVDVTIGAGAGSTCTIAGNLTVSGTTTTVNSTTLTVADDLITVSKGNDTVANANGSGMEIDATGGTNLYWKYVHANTAWQSNVDIDTSATGNVYKIAGTEVLGPTTLGSGVLASSLTSLGTIASLVASTADINAGTVDNATIGATTHTTGKFTTCDATTDFTIDGLVLTADTITNDAALSIVSTGLTLNASLDIALSADGGNVTMDDGTTTIFDFNVDDTTLTIHDDQDTGDKFTITVAQHGVTTIATVDDDGNDDADLTLDADGDINLNPVAGGKVLIDGNVAIDGSVVTGASSITSTAFVGNVTGTQDGVVGGNTAAAGTFTTLDCTDGAFALANLDIDGGTDINAAIVDADLMILDDGAGGANRKCAMSRVKTYIDAVALSDANTFTNTITVGSDGTGYDVKFFGDTAGAYGLWDQSEDKFIIRGPVGTGTATPGVLRLETAELTVVDADQLGRIEFIAPLESGGTDAILVAASIWAEADADFTDTANECELVFATAASEAAAEKMRLTSDGKLGIGTATPGSLLHVAGTVQVGSNTAGQNVTFFGGTAAEYMAYNATANTMTLANAAGSTSLVMGGSAADTYAITVGDGTDQNADKIQATAFVTHSDERLKKDIQPMKNPMDKLNKLQGVTYNWKKGDKKAKGWRSQEVGFLAQDVRKVLPQIVAVASDGGMGIDYSKLTAVLTEAVKQQDAEIKNLRMTLSTVLESQELLLEKLGIKK
jgi:hypothetical protein